ncbi:MAG: hypothetical protein J7K73_00330 [Nanoarchaeota archaeon]|nr:hypothetical protein [Nanoarchaeota archaeon]
MKKILFLLMFLVVISLANARSLDISIDKKELAANSEITITYSIKFDEVETFSYQVGIKGVNQTIVLLEKNVTTDSESGSITWNTQNYPAGEYEAYVFISPSTYWPSSKFEILPFMDFNISVQKLELFVYEKSITKSFEINNLGNVPIFVSLSPKGLKSESSIVPLTMNIGVNGSANVLFSVEKPKDNYNASLTVEASWGNLSQEVNIPIYVYNPIVIIEAENITLEKSDNLQVVTGVVFNKGNVPRDLTLTFYTDGKDVVDNIRIPAGKSYYLNYTFPLDTKVKSLEIAYINSNGKEETIIKNFGLLPSIHGIKFNFDKNTYYILGGIIVLIAAISLFLKFKKKKISEEGIDLEKLNRQLGR